MSPAETKDQPGHTGGSLLELARRCEEATGPDRELDRDIWMALNPKRVADWIAPNGVSIHGYAEYIAPQYSFSLDAAMRLVPEGHGWRMGAGKLFGKVSAAAEVLEPGFGVPLSKVEAKTPALALTAASLRALSLARDAAGPAKVQS